MKYLKVLLLIAAIFIFVVACGDDDPFKECENVRDCSGTGTMLQACCTPTQCKYVIGDEEFPCDGLSCSSATASEANSYCDKL
jgi:hypothetical protein